MEAYEGVLRTLAVAVALFGLYGCVNDGTTRAGGDDGSVCRIIPPESVGNAATAGLVAAAADTPVTPKTTKRPPEFVPGEVVVKFKNAGATLAPRSLELGALGTTSLSDTGRRTSGGEKILRLNSVGARAADTGALKDGTLEAVEQLKQRPDVEYAHPNYIFRMFANSPDDVCYTQHKQWSLLNNGAGPDESPGGINMPKAWLRGHGSQQITVSVVDTGIVAQHADLNKSNLINGYSFVSPNRGSNPTDSGDGTHYHGTHVASVIGAVSSNNGKGMAGINWAVHVQPVRVLGAGGNGSFTDIADGLRWAAGLPVPGAPNNANPAKVINMSLGGAINCSEVQGMQVAIDDVTAKGALVIVAAGNDADDAGGYTPAGCRNVLAVSASGPTGALAPYSNFGSAVGILAPGGDTSLPDGGVLGAVDQNAFSFYQGTSMATPHVAGVAALVLSRFPQLSPTQLAERIKSNAIPRSPMQCLQPCGSGLLNADIP